MRILLVEPNSRFAIRKVLGVSGPPLGLAYIASYLREYGRGRHQVMLVDALTLDYSQEQFQGLIREFGPDVVGISAISTSAIDDVYEYARLAKEADSGVRTVVGGNHVSFTAEDSLRECSHVDIIVCGEAEETFLDLVDTIRRKGSLGKVRGIAYRSGSGRVIRNSPRPLIEDLDTIPMPAYDQLPMNMYRMGKERFMAIITSRGCPFGCIFCSSSRLMGKRYRERSAKNIVEEIRVLNRDYGISNIEIIDDMFVLKEGKVKEFHDLLKKEGLKIHWSCSSRVDIIARKPGVLKHLKESGCHTIYVGAESGSQKSLDRVRKGITLDQTREAVRLIKQAGIGVFGSFIIGIPGETREDIKKTIRFAMEIDPDLIQFTVCTPYPGTPLYEYAKKEGLLLTGDWKEYTVLNPVMRIPGIPPKEIKKMLGKAYFRFYIRPRFLWKNIKRRNTELLKKVFTAGFRYVMGK